MNNFTMTCKECDTLFKVNDTNRHNWSKGMCDTCMVAMASAKAAKKGQHA
jgi:hypothetical protein